VVEEHLLREVCGLVACAATPTSCDTTENNRSRETWKDHIAVCEKQLLTNGICRKTPPDGLRFRVAKFSEV
jgi:hypothetical protein